MTPLIWLAAYLLGSMPWALIVVRLRHQRNVLHEGTGNVGARNALRTGGRLTGVLVLLLDIAKGTAAPLLARAAAMPGATVAACGVLVVVGHCFSLPLLLRQLGQPWDGWRTALARSGGMGLASAMGVLLVLAPWVALAVFGVGLVLTFGPKWNLGTAVAMVGVGVLLIWLLPYAPAVRSAVSLMGVIISVKHLPDLLADREAAAAG